MMLILSSRSSQLVYPIINTRYSVMCNVYTEYYGTSEIQHGLCAFTIDNPLAKSLRTCAQTMPYLHLIVLDVCPNGISFQAQRKCKMHQSDMSLTIIPRDN